MENIIIYSERTTVEREDLAFKIIEKLIKKDIEIFAYNLIDYNNNELNENINFTNILTDEKLRTVLKEIKNTNDKNKKVIVLNDLAVSFLMNNGYSDIIGLLEYLIKNRKKYNLSFVYTLFSHKDNLLFNGFIKEFEKRFIFNTNNYKEISIFDIGLSEFEEIKKLKPEEYYLKIT